MPAYHNWHMHLDELIYKPDSSSRTAWYSYICGHCETKTTGFALAYSPRNVTDSSTWDMAWLICSNPECGLGSLFIKGKIIPEHSSGFKVDGLSSEIESAYNEGRKCFSVGAYTSCELICRKILMHVACDKGAAEGLKFVEYIDYLKKKGYVTSTMELWVTMIKDNGNESTHKLKAPDRDRADSTLMFTGELLKLIYEMEKIVNKFKKTSLPNPSTPSTP